MGVNMGNLMVFKCRIDYIIAPLKILQSLEESVTDPHEKYGYIPRLTPAIGKTYEFTEEEVRLLMMLLVPNSRLQPNSIVTRNYHALIRLQTKSIPF